MKAFRAHAWNPLRCLRELEKLRKLLTNRRTLSERGVVLPLFRQCLQLSALLGYYHPGMNQVNRLAFEFDLFGDFSCDLVVGDSQRHAYLFVECEDGKLNSVFKRRGKKSTRDWSPTFEHGCSQIIDWFKKLHDTEKSDDFETRFGARSIDYAGLLIVGRDHFFEAGERLRLEWRRQRLLVDSRKIHCVTYDELLDDLTLRIERALAVAPS
jgi:hypothetical protein